MKSKERPVIVTTEFKGVFFGYATDTSGDPITLKNCRNVISWSADIRGFIGLAALGPNANCRIGPACEEIELRKITSVINVSPEALTKWESLK